MGEPVPTIRLSPLRGSLRGDHGRPGYQGQREVFSDGPSPEGRWGELGLNDAGNWPSVVIGEDERERDGRGRS